MESLNFTIVDIHGDTIELGGAQGNLSYGPDNPAYEKIKDILSKKGSISISQIRECEDDSRREEQRKKQEILRRNEEITRQREIERENKKRELEEKLKKENSVLFKVSKILKRFFKSE